MRRAALAVATLAALGLAVPSHADYPPTQCAGALALAATGGTGGCATIGGAPLSYGRAFTVAVQTGQVSATVGCGGAPTQTFTVTAPWSQSAFIPQQNYCWVQMTALVDKTTAVALNVSGQAISTTGIPPLP